MRTETRRPRDHYGYTYYRDPRHAREFDGDRFGGPVGAWIHRLEVAAFLALVEPAPGDRILDVGAGTGKLALPFASAGACVVAADASGPMLAEARAKLSRHEASGSVHLAVLDGHELPFPDRAFDAATASRVLMHVPDPVRFLAELCRVSRRRVVVDVPPRSSSNALQPLLLAWKRRVDPQTHPYRVFSLRWLTRLLRAQGFRVARIHRQLFLPHFLHRRLGRPGLSTRMEAVLRALGLTRLLGAPAILAAERRETPTAVGP